MQFMLLMQAGDSLSDVLRVGSELWLEDELGSFHLGCLKQLVFTTKQLVIITVPPVCLQPG